VITRRLLLGHGVTAGFVLPTTWNGQAQAASPSPGAVRRVPPAAMSRALPLVMLDPGHGGKDPGAIGVSGTYEKHVAFATAQELRRQLQASGRYRVELTRTRDEFIPLEERVGVAQQLGALLFVSMHADALGDHSVRGASVYTLSDTASDQQTEALARRENSADRFAGPAFRDAPPEVARILASLVRQETRTGSARMARDVVSELERSLPLLVNPSRHAGFVVLKAADIPSVLVEMGFMSNRADEAALQRPEHRALVASAMKRAVDGYFNGTQGVTAHGGRTAG
jgi:N-acetylmuramoyl-L-alanine amidase